MPDDLPPPAVTMPGPLYALDDMVPVIDPTAWIAPSAAVIGDVVIGARSSVWFHCVLRGDGNHIRVGSGTNIQDGTVVHIAEAQFPAIIGDDVSIGHAAIIHACTLENRAFVGMGATVLDGAIIREGGMLAAGAVLTPGKIIGPNELWAGTPARFKRLRPAGERAEWDAIATHYAALAARFRTGLRPVG